MGVEQIVLKQRTSAQIKEKQTQEKIRKVASPHVRFASQIRTAQGNLTLLYSQNLRFFLYNRKWRPQTWLTKLMFRHI